MRRVKKPMDRDISCVNSRALINYISTKLGKDGVNALLEGLIDNEEFVIEDKYEPGCPMSSRSGCLRTRQRF
jgi:hypothetical protein